jgi:hypothetical protein
MRWRVVETNSHCLRCLRSLVTTCYILPIFFFQSPRTLSNFSRLAIFRTVGTIQMDPGTALGAISLGIEVCKGLLDYYRTWNEHEVDIKQTSNKIAVLCLTL